MKHVQEKVKDIVEVRPYSSIRDFIADPAETLSNYHFTDATADLMAKWLEGISTVQEGRGTAFALAGYRGVGKSHFLATLGALAANPELRTRISESHVAFSAQRLQRRHYTVAYLRRGTDETLLEEFKAAMSSVLGPDTLSNDASYEDVLRAASEKSGDTPFILMIDTAFERGSRVSRDDGVFLSEIAEAAKNLNVFVGVALDDDIAGADGSNSSLVRSYSIDYLDQAHLYKVVNSYIFPKHNQMQPVLHEIYTYFREVLPSFRWSEQKFSSLYPLHPAILEVAPYVRLYVHDFALLGFASEAGEKILGRPSNSLIALDEVYDSAESGLRKIDDLSEAFAAYDKLNSTVVGKIPVMQRLQAKLILKALLLLSLDGQGATANDICASVLIFEKADPEKAVKNVEDLLKKFAEELPDQLRQISDNALETRYSFKVSSKENLNKALMEAHGAVSADTVSGIIRRVFQERFTDAAPAASTEETDKTWIDSRIVWRGGVRRGRVFWNTGEDLLGNVVAASDTTDWEVFIDLHSDAGVLPETSDDISRVIWKPDPLRPDEVDKVRSYHILRTDGDLREKFSEQIRASIHTHAIAVEKILNRSFLEDGKLIIDGFDYNFTEEARSAQSMSELFAAMLEPLFEARYPAHPYFTRTLDHADVASIVTDLYNGTRLDLADVQSRAQTFAFPLGIVRLEGTAFVPESLGRLVALPVMAEVLNLVGEDPVSLTDVYAQLRKGPNGLVREAQQMVLTALVAQRQIEFVTSSGNRINRRSLDLKIIWDDIVGIAKPIESSFSGEKLKRWADLFIKDGGDFQSLDRHQDREILRAAFAKWTAHWTEIRLLDRFGQLPDDVLNVRIWQLAARAGKTFGSVAERIAAASEGTLTLEDCLDGIADAFSESEAEFKSCEVDLEVLSSFVKGAELRDEVRSYLAVCEVTEEPVIEELRERAVALVEAACSEPSDARNREMGYVWEKFKREFIEHFYARHATVMRSPDLRSQLDEILRSDEWWEFELLSGLPVFDPNFLHTAGEYQRRIQELDCRIDSKEILQKQPFCLCTFSLNKSVDCGHLPSVLKDTVREGLRSFRSVLSKNSDDLIKSVESLSDKTTDTELQTASTQLVSALSKGGDIPPFTDLQLKILREIFADAESGHAKSKPLRPANTAREAGSKQVNSGLSD
ncbi:MAG: DUF6079 family protein [Pyrinomonadaceae bacterium]